MRNQSTLTFVLLFLTVLTFAFGWPNSDQIQNMPGANHGFNSATGVWQPIGVSGDGKLVTDASVTVGSVTVNPGTPPTSNQTDVVSVTSTAADITALSNRNSVSIFNHSDTNTVWVSFDSDTASATVSACVPVHPYGMVSVKLDSSKNVGLVASVTTDVTVYQDGF